MMNDSKISEKQKKELYSIRPLLYKFGFIPDESMCDDKPDICLKSHDNKIVGIEVINYTHTELHKNINTFNNLLKEYTKQFDEKKLSSEHYKQRPYRIKIWMSDGNYPNETEYKKCKDSIFREIDAFLFPNGTQFNIHYIAFAEAVELPSCLKTKAEIMYVVKYEQIEETIILDCINKKERKLACYKRLPKNNIITQYWLAICFPEHEQVDVKDFSLPNGVVSNYNKIFLIKGADCIEIWGKNTN